MQVVLAKCVDICEQCCSVDIKYVLFRTATGMTPLPDWLPLKAAYNCDSVSSIGVDDSLNVVDENGDDLQCPVANAYEYWSWQCLPTYC